jgi:hypothetical protein
VWGVRIQAGFHDSLVFFFAFNGMKGAAFTEKRRWLNKSAMK